MILMTGFIYAIPAGDIYRLVKLILPAIGGPTVRGIEHKPSKKPIA
jgi:hypothetical protein